jgi:hypothetical protein
MKAIEASLAGRAAIETLTGRPPEHTSRCEATDNGWELQFEVLETRGRLTDNDIFATYLLKLDSDGELLAYQRTRRYTRVGNTNLAA